MSYHSKREAKRNMEYEADDEELYGSADSSILKSPDHCSTGDMNEAGESKDTKPPMEQDKRLRREIANSNERRRMQSINSGFESLKTLIPHTDGEKLSKAAILHHTSDYITALESEKTRLLSQNAKLKREMLELGTSSPRDTESDLSSQGSPPPKRKKRDTESSDEGIGMSSGDFDEPTVEELKREMIYLRSQLDRERRLRIMLEEQTRTLESQLYPERLRQIASQVQAQMRYQEEKQKYLEEQRRIQEEQEEALVARNTPCGATPIVIAPMLVAATPAATPPSPPAVTVTTTTPLPATITATTPLPPAAAAVVTTTAITTTPPPATIPTVTIPAAAAAVKPRANQPPVVNSSTATSTNSMSRRNLETIVEAIRHLEGDNILFDCVQKSKGSSSCSSSSSAVMETDSVYGASSVGVASSSENEDDEEEWGRLSASPQSKIADATSLLALRSRDHMSEDFETSASSPPRHHSQYHHPHHHHLSSHHVRVVNPDRFPIASQLLQKQQQQQSVVSARAGAAFVPRPAVIVPNVS